MGLYDHFEPRPPIPCPHCSGKTRGWQGQPASGGTLLLWRQGESAPLGHQVDEDLRLSDEDLAKRRLEDESIALVGGRCERCGRNWWDSYFGVLAEIRDGVWHSTRIDPAPKKAVGLADDWVQCPQCTESYEVEAGQELVLCKPCSCLLQRPSKPR